MYLFRKRIFSDAPILYSYTWMLNKLNLMRLSHRRRFLETIFLYKSIRGLIDSRSYLSNITFFVPNSRTTRNLNTFYYSASRTNLGANSPLNRIMGAYNTYFSRDRLLNDDLCSFRRYVADVILEVS